MSSELAIGLEIHVQLATRTKMFCGDVVEFGAPPNTHVCPVCLGLPGALPVANETAVLLAVRAALGLGCTVHERSVFVRKNYFYPDLPKGYQITQLEHPLATGGSLEWNDDDEGDGAPVRIRRVHLEEDAGKSLHDRLPGRSAVDLNRAGVPLIEIVTEPDLRSPGQTRAFLARLKRALEYLGVSDCDMEKGSLRVDANLSVRSPDGEPGTPTELKNLNSFANVERALRFEADRQRGVLAAGKAVAPESLLWDADAGEARPLRSKTETRDYRYFADPDLPPLLVDHATVEAARRALPELPGPRARRLATQHGLPTYDADVLTATRALADYFEETAEAAGDAKAASNWITRDVLAWVNREGDDLEAYPVPPHRLGQLIRLVGEGKVSATMGREVLDRMIETGRPPAEIIEADGLAQVTEDARIREWVDEALAAHPEEAVRLREGEVKLRGFFVGLVMSASGGKADPRRAAELVEERSR